MGRDIPCLGLGDIRNRPLRLILPRLPISWGKYTTLVARLSLDTHTWRTLGTPLMGIQRREDFLASTSLATFLSSKAGRTGRLVSSVRRTGFVVGRHSSVKLNTINDDSNVLKLNYNRKLLNVKLIKTICNFIVFIII